MAVDRLGRHLLRIGAELDLHQHAIAGFDRRHTRAHRIDYTGTFLARHERQRRQELVLAVDHQQIGKIDARGAHVDEHFTRARRRHAPLFDLQRVGRAEFSDDECFH